jgi:glutamate-1-semialdehyde 2,1-aminomutase
VSSDVRKIEKYEIEQMKNCEQSKIRHEQAVKILVGGVNSPVRSFKRVGGSPLWAKRAEAQYLWDVDGHKYVDFVMSYGPHLFGHAHPKIKEAVTRALENSSCFGMSSEGELEWAELLLKRLPGAEKIRAMSSGTEACMTAVRLARGITGRDIIVKCAGHYHGHGDALLVDAGSGVATLSTDAAPDSAGLSKSQCALARVVQFNDVAQLENLFKKEGSGIACFILEPIMGNMGVVPPELNYLRKAHELCSKHGALLIFDEVMTGLRVHQHSAQGLYDIKPDLTTLGKIVGGGLPLSALAGPAKFMDQLAPLGPVYQAGTLSGNPLSVAAGIAMLKLLDDENPYQKLEKTNSTLESLVNEKAKHLPLTTNRVGSMISFFFRKEPVKNAADARAVDYELFNKFFWALLEEGIMIPPSPFEACFVSTAHTTGDFKGFGRVLAKL